MTRTDMVADLRTLKYTHDLLKADAVRDRVLAEFDRLTAENERLRAENAKYDAASLDLAAEIARLRKRLATPDTP